MSHEAYRQVVREEMTRLRRQRDAALLAAMVLAAALIALLALACPALADDGRIHPVCDWSKTPACWVPHGEQRVLPKSTQGPRDNGAAMDHLSAPVAGGGYHLPGNVPRSLLLRLGAPGW